MHDLEKLIIDKLFKGDIAGPFEYNDVRELANDIRQIIIQEKEQLRDIIRSGGLPENCVDGNAFNVLTEVT